VSLDFVRVLRAALCRDSLGGFLTDCLDVGDARTMRRLFARVGVRAAETPTAAEYLDGQRVIRAVALVDELKRVLTAMST
jgi:hypothetical protein